jgi:UDP-2,3-diacylglucosamine hydrolase
MNTLFISDLHLARERPQITAIFLDFLKTRAAKAQALYILGDFFDVWIGDDAMDDYARSIAKALRELADTGVPIYLMPGNRDFLYGHAFCQQSGVTLISDPLLIDLYGTPTLLAHGDALCSADKAYQLFRKIVRNPITQFIFLHLPLFLRKKIASGLRRGSHLENQKKSAYIMDVVQESVIEVMQKYHVQHLIHGHTHQPNVHHFMLDDKSATRTVLGSWEQEGHVLICGPEINPSVVTLGFSEEN